MGPSPFELLFRAHFSYIYRLARVFGAPEREAEDVAQEVFCAFHTTLDRQLLRSPDPLPWLRGTTYRVTRGRLRTLRREAPTDREGEEQELMDDRLHADVERVAALHAGWTLVFQLLETLDYERRVVFVLHEIEGLTLEQIAADLHIPPSTATSRLRRARADFDDAVRRHRAVERRQSVTPLVAMTPLRGAGVFPTPAGAEDRVWSRVRGSIPASAAPALPRTPNARAPVTALAFAAGLVVGAIAHSSSPPPPPPLPDPVHAPTIAGERLLDYIPASLPAPIASAIPDSASGPLPRTPVEPEEALENKERRCLQSARAPLDASHPDPREALRLLAQCESRYPHTRFPEARRRIRRDAEALLVSTPTERTNP